MNCTHCGKPLTVHVLDGPGGRWEERLYCAACRSFQNQPGDRRCLYCGSTYRRFLRSGLLGCARCYDTFAADLQDIVEKYRGRSQAPIDRSSATHRPGGLARSRSAELAALVLGQQDDGTPAAGAGEGHDRPAADDLPPPAGAPGETEPERSPILGCRLRLARNIAGLPFWNRLGPAAQAMLSSALLSPAQALGLYFAPADQYSGEPATGEELRRLQRSGMIPAQAFAARRVPGRDVWIYTGDEDHFRIQWLFEHESENVFDPVREVETLRRSVSSTIEEIAEIDTLFACQWHDDHGYLTACPGIGGAGIRLSVLLDLYALQRRGRWAIWQERLLQAGFEVRGSRGEGATRSGDER